MRLQYTSEFLGIAMSFRVAFSKRSWPYFLAVTLPWLVHEGQRTIRAVRRGAGLRRHEASYYRFFSHFKVRLGVLHKVLFELILTTFNPRELLIVVDDTLCPKWGKAIFGTGRFFDHVARPRPGFIWGHNWVVLAVVVDLFGVPVALPFWVSLYRPKDSCSSKEFRTRLQIVAESLKTVKTWTSLPIQLVADGAYNNESLLTPLNALAIPLVGRLRQDAVLHADPPKRRSKTRGRPPKYGRRLPSIRAMRQAPRGWRRLKVNIYRKEVTLEVKTFDAWWPTAGRKLRVVLTRDPRRARKGANLSTTDLTHDPQQVVETFARRWSIEQLFADAKQAVGLDSAEVRKENSVVRHAGLAFAFVTAVRVWAHRTMKHRKSPPVSFARQLSEFRALTITDTILLSNQARRRSRRNARSIADLLAGKVPA